MAMRRNVRFAIVPRFGIFEVSEKENITLNDVSGFEKEILTLLSNALNYQLDIVIPNDKEWGEKLSNGSFSGAIGMLHRNEADLAMGRMSITYDRAEVAWPASPYDLQSIQFVTRLPTKSVDTKLSYIYPFQLHLWLIIMCTFILMPLLFQIFMQRRYSLQEHIFNTVKLLLHQTPNYQKANSFSDKMLQLSFLIGVFLLSLSYSSVILAVLTLPANEFGLLTILQLTKAVQNDLIEVTAPRGSLVLTFLRKSPIENVRFIGKVIHEIDSSNEATKKSVIEDGSAYVTPDFTIKIQMGNELLFSREAFGHMYVTIYARKEFCCKEELNYFLERLTAAGIYQKISKDLFIRSQLQTINSSSSINQQKNSSMKLTLWKLSEAFVVLGIGLFVSLVVLIFECAFEKIERILRKGKKTFILAISLCLST
ncbi:glutamate [NMDA] receptor subunit 1-like [Parasteatoda tepidariorum]|uniref:glutamate [NMDA] receptor subunit 1-like n=1 Tax=Parasteatoda tepidariorum TaxID=114398 RepID=UPI0039BCF15E